APSKDNITNKNHKEHDDVMRDWLQTNAPTAVQVLTGGGEPSAQLKSSADTLLETMKLYPNAQIYVYGHSLGSVDAQYAISSVPINEISRIGGGFFYQGPNIYDLLTKEQKATADALTNLNKLFNY